MQIGTNILIAAENNFDTRWNTFRFKRILTGVSCTNVCVHLYAHTHTLHILDVPRILLKYISISVCSVQFMKSERYVFGFLLGPCSIDYTPQSFGSRALDQSLLRSSPGSLSLAE